MYAIHVVFFILIHTLATLQQSSNIKIQQKNVKFFGDIQPDYSIAQQIYQEIEQKERQKIIPKQPQPQPLQPLPKPSPPIQPHEPPTPQIPKVQQRAIPESWKIQKSKLNLQTYAEFEEGPEVNLKEAKSYVVNNINQRGVISNTEKITGPPLESTAENRFSQQQIQVQSKPEPAKSQQTNPNPEVFQLKKQQRMPLISREQQIIEALQRAKLRPETQPPPPPPTIPQLTREDPPQPAPEKVQTKAQNVDNIEQRQRSETPPKKTVKYLFSLFLIISILIIVFSYSPEQPKPTRKGYNPSDDEEVNLT